MWEVGVEGGKGTLQLRTSHLKVFFLVYHLNYEYLLTVTFTLGL